jgi:hypothetical protein
LIFLWTKSGSENGVSDEKIQLDSNAVSHHDFPIEIFPLEHHFLDFFHGHRLGILILHFWQDLRQQVLKTKKELLEAGCAEILWKAWMVGWLPFFFNAWS